MVFSMDRYCGEQVRDSRHSLWLSAGLHRIPWGYLSFLEILSSVTMVCVTHNLHLWSPDESLPRKTSFRSVSRVSGGCAWECNKSNSCCRGGHLQGTPPCLFRTVTILWLVNNQRRSSSVCSRIRFQKISASLLLLYCPPIPVISYFPLASMLPLIVSFSYNLAVSPIMKSFFFSPGWFLSYQGVTQSHRRYYSDFSNHYPTVS